MGRRGRRRKKANDENALITAVEALTKMMTPEVVLPIQLKSDPEDLPEFGLLRGVLLSALLEFADSFKPSRTPEQAARRRMSRAVAESWFAGDPGAPIDFELCCAMFGMSADEMRAQIDKLRARLGANQN